MQAEAVVVEKVLQCSLWILLNSSVYFNYLYKMPPYQLGHFFCSFDACGPYVKKKLRIILEVLQGI